MYKETSNRDPIDIQLMEAQFSRQPRDTVVKFRVNPDEKAAIEEIARQLGTDVSSAMRYMARKAKLAIIARKEDPSDIIRTTLTFDDGVFTDD